MTVINNPVQIAECDGPCFENGPEACDCGALMTEQHLITPPPELVASWGNSSPVDFFDAHWGYEQYIATQAANWGANQELEACCEWVQAFADWGDLLRQDRRPKPPSLKEQALATLESADGSEYPVISTTLTADQHALIRRALETLPDG